MLNILVAKLGLFDKYILRENFEERIDFFNRICEFFLMMVYQLKRSEQLIFLVGTASLSEK